MSSFYYLCYCLVCVCIINCYSVTAYSYLNDINVMVICYSVLLLVGVFATVSYMLLFTQVLLLL